MAGIEPVRQLLALARPRSPADWRRLIVLMLAADALWLALVWIGTQL